MKTITAIIAALLLTVVAAPAAHAAVEPDAQCYRLEAQRTVAAGDLVCRESGTMWRWTLVPSRATTAGAVQLLRGWWASGAVDQAHSCQRFGRYPTKFAHEVASAFDQYPRVTMVRAARAVFADACA